MHDVTDDEQPSSPRSESDAKHCAICLQPIVPSQEDEHVGSAMVFTCNHLVDFHADCLLQWSRNKATNGNVSECPICRTRYYPINIASEDDAAHTINLQTDDSETHTDTTTPHRIPSCAVVLLLGAGVLTNFVWGFWIPLSVILLRMFYLWGYMVSMTHKCLALSASFLLLHMTCIGVDIHILIDDPRSALLYGNLLYDVMFLIYWAYYPHLECSMTQLHN